MANGRNRSHGQSHKGCLQPLHHQYACCLVIDEGQTDGAPLVSLDSAVQDDVHVSGSLRSLDIVLVEDDGVTPHNVNYKLESDIGFALGTFKHDINRNRILAA